MKVVGFVLAVLSVASCTTWTPRGIGTVLFTDPYSGAETLLMSCPDMWSERERASGFTPKCDRVDWTGDSTAREAWEFQSRSSGGGRALKAGGDLLCFLSLPSCVPTGMSANNRWAGRRAVAGRDKCEAARPKPMLTETKPCEGPFYFRVVPNTLVK